MVVEDGVVKIKEPEKIIPATEVVIDVGELEAERGMLEARITDLQSSVNNDLAQLTITQTRLGKLDALLADVPSDKNVPIDGANGVG